MKSDNANSVIQVIYIYMYIRIYRARVELGHGSAVVLPCPARTYV